MPINISLTTAQKPIFKKVMKDAGIKIRLNDSSFDLTSDNYAQVAEAVADAWFKATLADSKDEKYLQQLNHRVSNLEVHFVKDEETNENE